MQALEHCTALQALEHCTAKSLVVFDSDQLQKVVWSSRVCTAAAKDHKEGCETLQVAEVNFGRVVHFPNLAISEHDGATGSVVDTGDGRNAARMSTAETTTARTKTTTKTTRRTRTT